MQSGLQERQSQRQGTRKLPHDRTRETKDWGSGILGKEFSWMIQLRSNPKQNSLIQQIFDCLVQAKRC